MDSYWLQFTELEEKKPSSDGTHYQEVSRVGGWLKVLTFFLLCSLLRATSFMVMDNVNEASTQIDDASTAYSLTAISLLISSILLSLVHCANERIGFREGFSNTVSRRQFIYFWGWPERFKTCMYALLAVVIPAFIYPVALQKVDLGIVATTFGAAPLFAQIISICAGQIAFSATRICGLLFGLCGILLISITQLLSSDTIAVVEGLTLMIVATLSISISSVFAQSHLANLDTLKVAQAVIIFSALIVIVLAVAEYGFSSDNSTWDFHLDAMTIFGVLFMGLFAYPVITYIDVRLVQSVGAVRQLLVYFGVPIVALVMKYLFNVENNDTSVSGLLLNVFGSFLAVIGSMLALRDSEKEYKAGLVSIDGMEERMLPSSSENSSGVRGGELDGLGAPMSDLGPFHFHSQNVEETAGIAESYRPAGRIQSFRF